MSVKEKSKWMSVLVPGFMSSDYSCSDSEDDALETRPLPWRSQKVTDFFYNLDVHAEDVKSAQAKKQTKERVLSDAPSSRQRPSGKFPVGYLLTTVIFDEYVGLFREEQSVMMLYNMIVWFYEFNLHVIIIITIIIIIEIIILRK